LANRYAVATGNWSNPAIWDGGTLPGIGDDVRANGFTVSINQDITVNSIRNDALAPAVNGGGFTLNSTTFNNLTLTCNIISHTANCLTISGNGVVNITGDIRGGLSNANNGVLLSGTTSNFTMNIVGDCYGGAGSGNSGCAGIFVGNSFANINLTGCCYGSTQNGQNNNNGISVVGGLGLITMNGVCYGRGAAGIFIAGNIMSLVGNIIAASSNDFDSVPGVACFSSNTGVVVSSVLNNNRGVGINGGVRLSDINPTMTVITQSGSLTLSDPAQTNPPSEENVRLGTVYGGGAYVGSLIVPNPSNVRLGIPTDNTVGTGIVTGEDFFNTIRISSDPLAERLRNVATVKVVGDQFNSFNAK